MATTINVILADSTTAITVSTGARGPAGTSAANSVTSATTSDGTAALYLDSIRFETTNGGPTQTGQMAWESTDGSIDAMLESGVIVAMGEDLVIRVRNATASPIAKGAALAYDGTVGASGRIDVKPWVGSNIATAKLFLGFAAAAIDANGNGYSQWFGKLSGINTSGGAQNWQDEQIIYAVPSASSTLTNVAPTSGEYAVAAVVINAGSGTSGILYVRPTFEKFPVSADITDATSDGQSNPGKVLKTDINGALQIEQITLGNAAPNVAGSVGIVGSVNTSYIANPDDSAIDLKFGTTSGAIISTGDASATFSSGKVILWGATADATLTNLGGGTAGKAIFGAATAAVALAQLGVQTKIGTSTGLSSVGSTDITGLTGFTLDADTWYKLEIHYLWTSTSTNFQIEFHTTGSFYRGGTTPALGQSMSSATVFSTSVFINDTSFSMRGSTGENRTNMPFFGYAVFKTNSSGTASVKLNLLSGSTLSTIASSIAVLTKLGS